MLRPIATLLLLLQLHPFGCIAACSQEPAVADAARSVSTASALAGATAPTTPVPEPDANCPMAKLCAVPVGALFTVQFQVSVATIELKPSVPSYTHTLHTVDPAAPLVPPPNV